MKKYLFTWFVLSLFISTAIPNNAQDNIRKSGTRSWIFMISDKPNSYNKIGPVSLFEIKDSSIVISKNLSIPELEIPVFDIGKIKTRRKNSILRGMVIGAVTGIVAGGLTGLISGDDPEDVWLSWTAEEKALALGVLLGAAGTGLGTIYGATAKISIPIHGNMDLFKQNKDKLRQYSIKK